MLGNGNRTYLNNGYSVDRNPRAGDIIWWGKNGGNGVGANGHVGFIHSVINGIIHYSEYNYDGNGTHRDNTISISSSAAEYTHVQTRK